MEIPPQGGQDTEGAMTRTAPVTFAYDFDKALAALVYLASNPEAVPALDKYKAGKLLFLADKYHLVRYGRPILGDFYRALDYGPIPQRTMDALHALVDDSRRRTPETERLAKSLAVDHRFQYPRFAAAVTPNLEALSVSELRALDHVVTDFGKKTFDELKALTHEMPAYRKARARVLGVHVVDMRYEDFFEEDPDAIAGALAEMLETYRLRTAFPAR
jgi:uncharacterized phage-associated protein